ncbi:hypothetical protein [Poseidonocella sp. HB161398]|uniref:hypothetical protein n=1 Tax=Poseidonocella sp. HB161398 TaxID=2320855 RepID=UPI001486FBB9|nr:hypothetical protein [Poseidonocella sp. HB161398]
MLFRRFRPPLSRRPGDRPLPMGAHLRRDIGLAAVDPASSAGAIALAGLQGRL